MNKLNLLSSRQAQMPNSHGSPHVPQRQAWSESERQAIRTYVAENPGTTWRYIKRWFEAQNPNKELTQSQISKILNPKTPRGPSDVDPVQVQKLRPDSKRIRTGRYTELEAALYQWQQLMQKNGQVGISYDLYACLLFMVSFRSFFYLVLNFSSYKHILVISIFPPSRPYAYNESHLYAA
ncbi:hypothetical protein L211DRAFT_143014 [Terfezia boudieri ATCC MYA-4762]|uniref:ARS-binding protein 1 N-terminal domain-containing protein n=1 Tax=Terfezia boudieri ATCC MYA-4762 TaxID=1051890 RepID=A0A3N4LTZ6_9PEZI|nr:hypothetical protein L211DRAFT_143014 [Terfezia boudieri ATCC MYA-4762]